MLRQRIVHGRYFAFRVSLQNQAEVWLVHDKDLGHSVRVAMGPIDAAAMGSPRLGTNASRSWHRRIAAHKRSDYKLTTLASFAGSRTVGTDECARLRADRAGNENVRRMRQRGGDTIEWFQRSSFAAVPLGPTGPRNLMKIYLAVRSQPPGAARSRTHWRSRSRVAV
jgi:hypothetical protein